MDKNFWKNKRVFITGHTGFKGTYLALWLQAWQAKVYGYSLFPPTKPAIFDLVNLEKHIKKSVIGDINDFPSLKEAMLESNPDIVIHLAAQPIVRLSYDEPLYTYQTNVLGTANVLEAARLCPHVKAILVITTDKCYENKEWPWGYRENDQLGGYDPYSASKACAELVTSSYRQSFFNQKDIAISTARAGNVIGGGDWAKDRLLPDCLNAIEKKESIIIRNPNAIRAWQHVLEPLSGYIDLTEKMYLEGKKWGQAWNFGPDNSSMVPVKAIVDYLCKKLDGKYSIKEDPSNKHEASLLMLDCAKAKRDLNWSSIWNLEKTLDKIISWQNSYWHKADMFEVTAEQIHDYIKERACK